MDRRNALKNLGILSGSLMLFPSCDFSQEKVILTLNKLKITESEVLLMKELVDCLVPDGEFSGAGALQVQDVVWVMSDDCLDSATQDSFLRGLKTFESLIKNVGGKSFQKMTQEERVNTLAEIVEPSETEPDPDKKDVISFIEITKDFTILGYMNSEYIMTEVMPYSLIPGTYGLCETIDNDKRINVNA